MDDSVQNPTAGDRRHQKRTIIERMSLQDSKSLDDTIPLEKDAPVMGSPLSDTSSLGSDLSVSSKSNSRDSSVEIVYDSKSLDDTIPLEKDSPDMRDSRDNTFSLCSDLSELSKSNSRESSVDLSDTIKTNSRESSVEIVYDIINITDTESENEEDQEDQEDKL